MLNYSVMCVADRRAGNHWADAGAEGCAGSGRGFQERCHIPQSAFPCSGSATHLPQRRPSLHPQCLRPRRCAFPPPDTVKGPSGDCLVMPGSKQTCHTARQLQRACITGKTGQMCLAWSDDCSPAVYLYQSIFWGLYIIENLRGMLDRPSHVLSAVKSHADGVWFKRSCTHF